MVTPLGVKIGILQVAPYTPHKPLGGAEAVADEIARGLSDRYDVCVFHGFDRGRSGQSRRFSDTLHSLTAFPITDVARHHGILNGEVQDKVWKRMEECRVMIGFERIMRDCPTRIKYAVLGGICYSHCDEIIHSGCWDRLIVPSAFLYDEVAARRRDLIHKVSVISNGVDQAIFCARPPGLNRPVSTRVDVVIPSRPDSGKGFKRALALANASRSRGLSITIHCFEQESFLGPTTFYEDLQADADGLDLVLHPWVDRREMPSVYWSGDLTLCLGDLPEGFGMTVIESISCGTPVLATPVGFLTGILPPSHGLFYHHENKLDQATVERFHELVTVGREDCYQRGIRYISNHYSSAAMMSAYQALIEEDVQ
jgi:glycosyltransferase involved in cell wall biosynthesis